MLYFKADLACGCCYSIMSFESLENLKTAYEKAGLGSNQIVLDDNNETHENIDTFYPPQECDKFGNVKNEENKLLRLFNYK